MAPLDLVYNSVKLSERAVEKGATSLLIPLNARKHLNDLSEEMSPKVQHSKLYRFEGLFVEGIVGVGRSGLVRWVLGMNGFLLKAATTEP